MLGIFKSSIYRARPLNLEGSTNIRVIEVLPNDTHDSEALIYCKLHVFALEDKSTYNALSYVWGDEGETKKILLDGKRHTVRENLWNFLHQYRRSIDTAFLWIDALCIDQCSIKERNHQVALMGQIYSQARLVISWLGHGLESSLSNVSTIEKIQTDIHLYTSSLMNVSSNKYWTRLWIVQEFVLAQHLEIWSGSFRTDGHVLVATYMQYKQTPYGLIANLNFRDFPALDANFQQLKSMDIEAVLGSRHAYHQSESWPVISDRRLESRMLFGSFAFAGCADARDRVYGVLGLLDQQELKTHPIDPDYSKSRSELFLEIFDRQKKVSSWGAKDVDKSMRFAHSLMQALELDTSDESVKLVSKRLVRLFSLHKPKQASMEAFIDVTEQSWRLSEAGKKAVAATRPVSAKPLPVAVTSAKVLPEKVPSDTILPAKASPLDSPSPKRLQSATELSPPFATFSFSHVNENSISPDIYDVLSTLEDW